MGFQGLELIATGHSSLESPEQSVYRCIIPD